MANTVSRRSVVYDILFEIESGKKSAKEAEDALDKLGKKANDTESSVKKLGKAFLAAFAIEELTRKMVAFATEAVNMARQSEGVRRAFERLNDPNLLNNLRTATRGTVNDLTLMQAAVRAQNFKIPLQQLGTFFDFASKRARDTGQSVDYLVNSIIDGIGRKSTLVLDNLGLSAAEIQQEFAKTGDLAVAVGNIIEREMGGAASAGDLAAESIDRYNVAIENLKVKIGEELIPVLGKAAELMLDIFSRTAVEDIQKTRAGLVDEFEGIIERAPEQLQKLISGLDRSQLAMLRTALEIAKTTGIPLENLIELEGAVGAASIGFTKLGETMRLGKKDADDYKKAIEDIVAISGEGITGSTRVAITAFDLLNLKVVEFGEKLRDVFTGKQDANIKALNDQLSNLKKELTETDLPRDKVIELTEKIKTLEAALSSLFSTGKEMPDFVIEFGDPLAELNKMLDESAKKAAQTRKEFEELGKLKFEVPEEQKPEDEEAQLIAINKQLETQRFIREELTGIIGEQAGAVAGLLQAVGAGAEAQLAFSIVSTLASQGEAIGKGIASASALPYPANLGAIASVVATIIGTFAQVFSLINQANAAKAQAQSASAKLNQFAEGEVDIHRPGEVRGKDSIPAVIMPGESVITTDKTRVYKPFLKAIHEGTLEDLIRVNYVEPALAVAALDSAKVDSTVDYSQRFYKQLLATNDGNSINKQAIRELRSINKKLTRRGGGWYV